YFGKIQDKDDEYYSEFPIVVCGLDSVEARRWINAMLFRISEMPQQQVFMIDGGTEGFKGQARVITFKKSACYECSLGMTTAPVTFPMCTIANTPRLPEHCIEWASVLHWPKEFPNKKLDGDDPEHIKWLVEQASARAKEFNITGVTYTLTQGVVKNIIPAIASTNAIVAAACANEAFKLATGSALAMENYMQYTGDVGVHTFTFGLGKIDNCAVCSVEGVVVEAKAESTLGELVERLKKMEFLQIKQTPSVSIGDRTLYMRAPPVLESQTRPNLDARLDSFMSSCEYLSVIDSVELKVTVKFADAEV
ncbi:hypothetical protein BDK51DRAFT_24600, partial [Blyttiomyces helicus]